MKKIGGILAGVVACVVGVGSVFGGTYGGGSGTAADPYQIWTPEQMNAIGANLNDWDKSFVLMDDIDMSIYTGTEYAIIGDSRARFSGTFDGNGHVISNLTYTRNDTHSGIGLFGRTHHATIMNLGLENVSIASGGNWVGGLVGYSLRDSLITDCYSVGTVSGMTHVGGLVGWNEGGRITACYAAGPVVGQDKVGGLVGWNSSEYDLAIITSCYATGSVNGSGDVGGLVGLNSSYSQLTACHANCSVNGSYYVGGLAGENDLGPIATCYATGPVSGNLKVGGLVGENDSGPITACYAAGAVSGTQSDCGGLVGWNDGGPITTCYAIGSVSGIRSVGGLVGSNYSGPITTCYAAGSVICYLWAGGLVGSNGPGTLAACFWDIESSGKTAGVGNTNPDPSGVTGLNTTAMKSILEFTLSGWDFTNESTNGTADTWRLCIDGASYPRLAWEYASDYSCPDGISTEDLLYISSCWLEYGLDPYTSADRTGDGVVNIMDYALLAEQWLSGI